LRAIRTDILLVIKVVVARVFVSVMVAGKCGHGGLADTSRSVSPIGGINKDTDDAQLSPHHYLHGTVSE